MIAVLDKEYDLWLGYSWSQYPQGICGHLYECIEYYHILKKHFRVGIVLCEEMPLDIVEWAIRTKYDFSDDEIAELLADIRCFDIPKVIRGSNLLLADGNFTKMEGKHLLFDNIMAFPCNDRKFSDMTTITAFQDYRIYGECSHHKHYIKKILFDRYRRIDQETAAGNLLYVTSGPRAIPTEMYGELESLYSGDFILLTDMQLDVQLSDRFKIVPMPVENLFNQFTSYIYTPTERQFDCSSRFIAECAWYNKQVIYHNINYWDIDRGLYWRRYDIEHDFNSIVLRDGDPIIDLIKGVIE